MAKWCTQSVLVRRGSAHGKTAREARAYVKRQGYRAPKPEVTPGFYRFRQASPKEFARIRTVCVSHSVCLVRGTLKGGRKFCPA